MESSNSYRKNVIWNIIFSILNAGQSMILLMLVNRLTSTEDAGMFSIAFSIAVLMMNVGSYGIRNYQVSDVNEKYSFGEYCGFRMISCSIMMLTSTGYIWIKGYTSIKAILILFLCGMRVVECLEDVIHGRYQQKQQLFLGCKLGTIRITASIVMFLISLLITQNIVTGVIVYAITNLVSFVITTYITIGAFGGLQISFSKRSFYGLSIECFPLFCGYFFSTYIGNVAKYAIDDYGTYQMQAHFNMIFMPVLVINLVSTMIFRPIIVDMATLWNDNKIKNFEKIIKKQLLYIGGLALAMIPCGILIGMPILSLFYGTNLSDYKVEFAILLLGGSFSAVSSFLNVCIITIREQRKLLFVIAGISIIAMITGGIFVKNMGMMGAAYLYLLLTILQAIAYFIIQKMKIQRIDIR